MSVETHSFQAEINQLLDIVIHSLYTDREIFVRELISNASDALEKVRHEFVVDSSLEGSGDELQVKVEVDGEKKTFTITDNGIGMTREELSENLGTIAHSGTKKFLTHAVQAAKEDVHLIGQFGVGFYSAFMVADNVRVETKSFHPDAKGQVWQSKGTGSYTLEEDDSIARGTKITIELKDDAENYSDSTQIKTIIRKFSNFVSFPINVNDEKVNTIQAIWGKNKSEITEEEYTEFYKFIANAYDEPQYRIHFSVDAPLAINSLLFVPKSNVEEMGFGRMEPGVDLYCKKVLIQKQSEKLLPEWLRFVKGVIDSDDLPLNISRETMQDSALVRKISKVITGRMIRFFGEQAKKEAEKYDEFFSHFGRFIKEGITTDLEHKEALAKLLRFETSKTESGKKTSLAEYLERMPENQKEIYYISGPTRAAIESGPYAEALLERDFEVIYNFDQIDDFVFDHLQDFDSKPLKSADRGDLDLPDLEKKDGEELSKEDTEALCGWIKTQLGERIGSVRASKRLVNNPAAIVTEGQMTATMQRLMSAMNKDMGMGGQTLALEVNPRSPLIIKMNSLRDSDESFAQQLSEQLYDNSMLAAGLMTDPRAMVARLNTLLSKAAGL
jgi:TNF receptor-associated protein 1